MVEQPDTAMRPDASRLRRLVLPVWITALSLGLLGPALFPGFVLTYDMVFVPRQDLLPSSIGLGGGLPRAVPQDAVVAIMTTVVDGAWLQHAVLLAIPILAASGVARVVAPAGLGAQLVAATLAVWNPFVVERLIQGHWALLVAYALTPWAIARARTMRGSGRGGVGLVGLCAGGALVPSGGLLVAFVAIPIAIIGGAATTVRKVLVMSGVIIVNLPWILPAVLHPASGAADEAGASVFALRSEGPWGIVGPAITALGGGGLWNLQVEPVSRGSAVALVFTIAVVVAAVAGWSGLRGILGTAATWWWTAVSVAGWLLAASSAMAPQVWTTVISAVPGGGLARDSHKLLAPLVLLLAVTAALGVHRGWRRISDPTTRRSLIVAAVLVPIAAFPDAAMGASGRLSAVDYPSSWSQMRAYMSDQTESGDVIVLPWSSFRDFAFNDGRTVLDPAPRWLPRSTIAADSLPVVRDGGLVVVAGDDPRSDVVDQQLAQGRPLAEVMPGLGARWIVNETSQRPQPDPIVFAGVELVWQSGDLQIWQLPSSVVVEQPSWPAGGWWVVIVDLMAALLVSLIILYTVFGRWLSRYERTERRFKVQSPWKAP